MFFRIKKSGPRAYVQVVEERTQEGAWRRAVSRDVIEEKLFDRRRDLFTDLSACSWIRPACCSTARAAV